jgi:glycosyltransferase involved in cell wall biosynthesis
MKQRILLYTDDSGEGGVALYNHLLLCELAVLGYQTFHAQGAGETLLIKRQKELGVQQVELGFTAGKDFSRSIKDFDNSRKILLDVKPDLVFISDGWPFSNFTAKQAAIDLGIPYITVLNWMDLSCSSFSYGDGISYIDTVSYHYNQAKAVIAVSHDTSKSMQKIFKIIKNKVQVIYYGIPATYFDAHTTLNRQMLRHSLGIPTEAVVCFTSARLATVKGHQYQLEAIQQLRKNGFDQLYFLWAGTGGGNKYVNVEEQLKASVRQLGLSDRVKFLGQRTDIPDLLDASDIFILTSKAEGMPLSIMEAMAKGLPIIATAVSGIPEELGTTGKLLPDPNSNPEATINELVTTLQIWSTAPQMRHYIGQMCKQRAESLFTEARMVKETIQVIERVISPPEKQAEISLPDSAWAEDLRQRIRYGALTWKAWRAYCTNEPTDMSKMLQASLKSTPFSKQETVLNWVENFSKFSLEEGDRFDTYALVNSTAWEKVMRSIYSISD